MINAQSSIKINNIYFDPYKIEDNVHDARMIFIIHSHYDHFDIKSIDKIKNDDTIFVVPDDRQIIDSLQGLKVYVVYPGKEYEIDNLKIKTVPSYNVNKTFHKKEFGWTWLYSLS